LLNRFPKVLRS